MYILYCINQGWQKIKSAKNDLNKSSFYILLNPISFFLRLNRLISNVLRGLNAQKGRYSLIVCFGHLLCFFLLLQLTTGDSQMAHLGVEWKERKIHRTGQSQRDPEREGKK
jgi:hypothetical protein